jgi:rhodanese-related sulfurtransferase
MLALIGRAVALVAAGCLVGAAANALRPDGVRPGAFTVATSCAAKPAPGNVTRMPPSEAVTLCGDPGVLIADVRAPERYAAGHIADAIHLPCAAPGDNASRALALLADKHTLIVYGDDTAEAEPVAQTLRQRLPRPDTRVVIVEGGFPAWDRAGLACSSGPCPECKAEAQHQEHRR